MFSHSPTGLAIIFLYYTLIIGSGIIVILRDPAALEYVLRAEGEYPVRDDVMSSRMTCLFTKKAQLPVSFTFK